MHGRLQAAELDVEQDSRGEWIVRTPNWSANWLYHCDYFAIGVCRTLSLS